MDAKIYLRNYSKRADSYLKKFFASKKRLGAKIDDSIVENLSIFENYTAGGKKLRGALTVLGYQITGGKDFKAILPVSCGIELIHNFLLIHDDIIDSDEERRGKPTLHKSFAKENGEHFGISKALLVGDVGAFLAYELIAGSNFSKEKIARALRVLNEYLLKTGYGQILDIEFDFKDQVSWDDIFKVRTYKTAYYTFVMPLTVGAVFGRVNKGIIKAIEKYGLSVGIAFQLADDILSTFGDPVKTGKSNESDIRDGKKTFLFVKALEFAKNEDRRFLIKWYGAKRIDKEKITRIREIFTSSGSLDYSRQLTKEMSEEGKKYIPRITKNPQFSRTLSSLADFVIQRDK